MKKHSLFFGLYTLVTLLLAFRTHGLSEGEDIVVYAKALKSLRTGLSYEYYSLPLCKPPQGAITKAIGLGDVLKNDRLVSSPYQFKLGTNENCKLACKLNNVTTKDTEAFVARIKEGYSMHMSVEGLPVAQLGGSRTKGFYHQGFPIGKVQGEQIVIFNHLRFLVFFHNAPGASTVIKAVFVTYSSAQQSMDASSGLLKCDDKAQTTVEAGKAIHFTYDVVFHERKDALRTDAHLAANTPLRSAHWSSIYNTFLVFLFLSFIVSVLVRRTLHANVPGYSQLATQDEARELFEETGWKVLHGDVLRPPSHPALFAVFVGTGTQITATGLTALALATFGIINPAFDGRFEALLPTLWILTSPIGGYASTRLSLSFQHNRKGSLLEDPDWWHVPLGLALLFPGLSFLSLLVTNFAKAGTGSIALPVGTVFGIVALWALAVLCTLAGAALAACRDVPEDPVRTNAIPRPIPAQPWYMWAPLLAVAAGVVPFIVTWGEVSLFLKSPFLEDVNPVAFHLLQAPLFSLIFAEVAVLLCFLQLARENYLWWWPSFVGVGSCGLYAFVWAAYVFANDQLHLIGSAAAVAFFSHALIVCLALFFVTGAISFYCSNLFVRHLYSKVPQ